MCLSFHTQPPSEFTEAMLDSVSIRNSQLHDYTTQIEGAVHDLISILLGHANSPSHSHHQSLSAGSRRHSGKQTMNLTPRTEASSGDTGDDMIIGDILCKYCFPSPPPSLCAAHHLTWGLLLMNSP